jgi:hypothetical protein
VIPEPDEAIMEFESEPLMMEEIEERMVPYDCSPGSLDVTVQLLEAMIALKLAPVSDGLKEARATFSPSLKVPPVDERDEGPSRVSNTKSVSSVVCTVRDIITAPVR